MSFIANILPEIKVTSGASSLVTSNIRLEQQELSFQDCFNLVASTDQQEFEIAGLAEPEFLDAPEINEILVSDLKDTRHFSSASLSISQEKVRNSSGPLELNKEITSAIDKLDSLEPEIKFVTQTKDKIVSTLSLLTLEELGFFKKPLSDAIEYKIVKTDHTSTFLKSENSHETLLLDVGSEKEKGANNNVSLSYNVIAPNMIDNCSLSNDSDIMDNPSQSIEFPEANKAYKLLEPQNDVNLAVLAPIKNLLVMKDDRQLQEEIYVNSESPDKKFFSSLEQRLTIELVPSEVQSRQVKPQSYSEDEIKDATIFRESEKSSNLQFDHPEYEPKISIEKIFTRESFDHEIDLSAERDSTAIIVDRAKAKLTDKLVLTEPFKDDLDLSKDVDSIELIEKISMVKPFISEPFNHEPDLSKEVDADPEIQHIFEEKLVRAQSLIDKSDFSRDLDRNLVIEDISVDKPVNTNLFNIEADPFSDTKPKAVIEDLSRVKHIKKDLFSHDVDLSKGEELAAKIEDISIEKSTKFESFNQKIDLSQSKEPIAVQEKILVEKPIENSILVQPYNLQSKNHDSGLNKSNKEVSEVETKGSNMVIEEIEKYTQDKTEILESSDSSSRLARDFFKLETQQEDRAPAISTKVKFLDGEVVADTQSDNVLDQVKIKLSQNLENGKSNFQVKLNPVELGNVEVRAEMQDSGEMKLFFIADKLESLHALQKDIKILEDALKNIGIETGSSHEFNLKEGNKQNSNNFSQSSNNKSEENENNFKQDLASFTYNAMLDLDNQGLRLDIIV